MSRARAKGTAAETAVVNYLRANGFPHAERRALAGSADRGDIAGIAGWAIEVKSGARLDIPGWLRETAKEADNVTGYGLLVVKPKGIGAANVGDWWAIQPLSQVLDGLT